MKKTDINILMVDDDEEDRQLLKDTFDELGFGNQVAFAENGEKALRYLQQCVIDDCLPCLMILDLNMPRLNGKDVLRSVKSDQRLHHITVVIYSTSFNPTERDACLALGATSYVVKPVTYAQSVVIATEFHDLCHAVQKQSI